MKKLLATTVFCLLLSVTVTAAAQSPDVGQGSSDAGQPGTSQPGMGQPGMGQPGMGQPGMGQPGMGQPGMGQPGMGMRQGRGMGRNMPVFADFDLDKNGYLDEKEFIEARSSRIAERAKAGMPMRGLSNMMEFSDLDANGDGKVTPDEFSQGVATHRQKRFQ
ncbi:MAG: hypothetical protein P8Z39_08780 [Gammaproteobacteria bacterium]